MADRARSSKLGGALVKVDDLEERAAEARRRAARAVAEDWVRVIQENEAKKLRRRPGEQPEVARPVGSLRPDDPLNLGPGAARRGVGAVVGVGRKGASTGASAGGANGARGAAGGAGAGADACGGGGAGNAGGAAVDQTFRADAGTAPATASPSKPRPASDQRPTLHGVDLAGINLLRALSASGGSGPMAVTESGRVVTQSGRVVTPSGRMLSPSGRVVTGSGRVVDGAGSFRSAGEAKGATAADRGSWAVGASRGAAGSAAGSCATAGTVSDPARRPEISSTAASYAKALQAAAAEAKARQAQIRHDLLVRGVLRVAESVQAGVADGACGGSGGRNVAGGSARRLEAAAKPALEAPVGALAASSASGSSRSAASRSERRSAFEIFDAGHGPLALEPPRFLGNLPVPAGLAGRRTPGSPPLPESTRSIQRGRDRQILEAVNAREAARREREVDAARAANAVRVAFEREAAAKRAEMERGRVLGETLRLKAARDVAERDARRAAERFENGYGNYYQRWNEKCLK